MMEKLAANRFRPAMPYGTNPHNKVLVSTQKQPLWDPLRKPQRPSKDVHRLSLRNQYSPKLSDMIPPPVNNGNKLPATDTFTSSASRGGPLKRLKPKRIFNGLIFATGLCPCVMLVGSYLCRGGGWAAKARWFHAHSSCSIKRLTHACCSGGRGSHFWDKRLRIRRCWKVLRNRLELSRNILIAQTGRGKSFMPRKEASSESHIRTLSGPNSLNRPS